ASLGLDEADFIRKTQATFKVGIDFQDWGTIGNRFFHGFGSYGPPFAGMPSHMAWLRLAREFDRMPALENWSMLSVMARHNKFVPPHGDQPGITDTYSYGFQFDAGLYAGYLRDYA